MLDQETIEEAEIVEDVSEEEQPDTEEGDLVSETEEDPAENDDIEDADAEEEEASDTDDELVVSFDGEEESDKEETPVIRTLRQKAREEAKKRKELEKKLEELTAEKPVDVGTKPTLKDCDYDDARFEAELLAWNDRKAKADADAMKAKEAEDAAKKAWDARLQEYADSKAKLGAKDFDEAEDVVKDVFTHIQQGILLDAADRPEILVYALGKNPAKAEELAKIENPVRLAAAIARLEGKMKVTGMSKKPAPEKRLEKAAPKSSGNLNKQLQALEDKADRTGDRTDVVAFKRKHKL